MPVMSGTMIVERDGQVIRGQSNKSTGATPPPANDADDILQINMAGNL
jgi:hypothetical protein